jgi:hypothetical protein
VALTSDFRSALQAALGDTFLLADLYSLGVK